VENRFGTPTIGYFSRAPVGIIQQELVGRLGLLAILGTLGG